jgi:hypothetical protein
MLKEILYINNCVGRINIHNSYLNLLTNDPTKTGFESYNNLVYKVGSFQKPLLNWNYCARNIYIKENGDIYSYNHLNSRLQLNSLDLFNEKNVSLFREDNNVLIFDYDVNLGLIENPFIYDLKTDKIIYEVKGVIKDFLYYQDKVLLYSLKRHENSFNTKGVIFELHPKEDKNIYFGKNAIWHSEINYLFDEAKDIFLKDPISFHGIYLGSLYFSFGSGQFGKLNLVNGDFELINYSERMILKCDWRDNRWFSIKNGIADMNKGVIYGFGADKKFVVLDLETEEFEIIDLEQILLSYDMQDSIFACMNNNYIIIIDYLRNGGMLILDKKDYSVIEYISSELFGVKRIPLEAQIKDKHLFVYDRSKSLAVYRMDFNK